MIKAVQKRLEKQSIKLGYPKDFNTYVLRLVIDFYNIKSDIKYSYEHKIGIIHNLYIQNHLLNSLCRK
ncbi:MULTISPECIES: hypothetical protein [Bacillus]|uniref:hypothetical protein n=1 Tax=Bacillus TaxID=1386 RepID=UPI0021003002|nr:hypothetical protein [Bacillus wiedmannii]